MTTIIKKRKYGDTASSRMAKRPRTILSIARPMPRPSTDTKGSFFRTGINYPLAASTIRTLRYAGQFSINSPVGTAGGYVFSANGLYDPDISGTGHQPYGFDQMMAMYNHYEVLSSCIRVTAFNTLETVGFFIGIKVDDNSTSTGDAELILEQPYWNAKPILSNQGARAIQVYNQFDAKKFFGDKSGDRATWGDVAANPQDQAYYIIAAVPITALFDLPSIPFVAEIEYKVKFHEPKELPKS